MRLFLFIYVLIIILIAANTYAGEPQNYKWRLPHGDSFGKMDVSDDNSLLVVAGMYSFKIFDLSNGNLLNTINHYGYESFPFAQFISNNELLIYQGDIYYYNRETNNKELIIKSSDYYCIYPDPALASDKNSFAFTDGDMVYIYDFATKAIAKKLQVEFSKKTVSGDKINDLVFSMDNQRILAATINGYVIVWELINNTIERIIDIISGNNNINQYVIECLDDNTFISNYEYGVWDYKTGKKKEQISKMDNSIWLLNLSKDKRYLAMDKNNHYVVYDLINKKESQVLPQSASTNKYKHSYGFVGNTNQVIYNYYDNLIKYDFEKGKFEKYLTVSGVVKFSPDNNYINSIYNYFLKLDINTGSAYDYFSRESLEDGKYYFDIIAYDDSCRYITGKAYTPGYTTKMCYIYDLETKTLKSTLPIPNDYPGLFKFSPDAKYISLSFDNTNNTIIKVFNTNDFSLIDSFQTKNNHNCNIEFSPNGKYSLFCQDTSIYSNSTTMLYLRDIKNNEYVCQKYVIYGDDFRFLNDTIAVGIGGPELDNIDFFFPCGNYLPNISSGDFIYNFKISKDSKYCLLNTEKQLLQIFDIAKRKKIKEYDFSYGIGNPYYELSYDNKYLAIDDDNYLYLFDFDEFINGVNDYSASENGSLVTLSPNPSDEELNLYVPDYSIINRIEIYNHQGISVYKTAVNNSSAIINTGRFPTGLYFVKVYIQGGETIYNKIIINH